MAGQAVWTRIIFLNPAYSLLHGTSDCGKITEFPYQFTTPHRVHPGDTYFQDWSFSRSVFVNTLERSLDRSISATRIQFRLSGFPRSGSLFDRSYMHITDYLFLQQPNGTDRNRCFSQNGQNGRTCWSKKKRLRMWELSIPDSYQVVYVVFLSVSHVLKNTCAIPGSLGQAAPSQSNMPGTSGFGELRHHSPYW